MSRIWAGLDAGKTHHHCVVIDAEGTKMLSRRVSNPQLPAHLHPRVVAAALGTTLALPQPHVQHRDVRASRRHTGERLPGVRRLAGDDDVRLSLEQVAHPSAYHLVVVQDEHPQR